MSTKVTPFMGGLGLDARGVLEVEANSTVTIGGGSGNLVVGSITASDFQGLTVNSTYDADTAVSIIDPAISIISNGVEFITIDQTQGVESQFEGNVSVGTNASNTFSVTGIFDLGSF